ncbi:MAG: IS91 family transposase [Planctomycetota bacterium]|jgi:hypothetical protein
MPEVADIFRLHGARYLDRFGQTILPSHRRALRDLRNCRTAALGGKLFACDHCGREHYVYHSCRNRACPKCHGKDTEAWLAARRQELLPVPYFHVVFTLPDALRELARQHQKTVYPILMKAAARALMKLADDPRYVDGLVGVLAVLHTWGRTLAYHPHVHCLVPGGGLTHDGQWRPARKNYLVPVRALSPIFRGMFLDLLAKALPEVAIPHAVRRQAWVVYCKPTVQGAENVLTYLGRYVHRIAITDRRILKIDDGQVTFRYQKAQDREWRTMTLPAEEFIRRFLQHVLPAGVHKVRYYGLWAPSNKAKLLEIRQRLTARDASGQTPPVVDSGDAPSVRTESQPPRCPFCQRGALLFLRHIPALQRSPP